MVVRTTGCIINSTRKVCHTWDMRVSHSNAQTQVGYIFIFIGWWCHIWVCRLSTVCKQTSTKVYTATSPIRPSVYNGHFFGWTVYTFPLVSTSLQWPLSSVPKVDVVERFNCTFKTHLFFLQSAFEFLLPCEKPTINSVLFWWWIKGCFQLCTLICPWIGV